MVAGLMGSAVAPALGFAMVSFAITGAGDGLFILSDRVLLQRMVPERLHGRAFGVSTSERSTPWAASGSRTSLQDARPHDREDPR